MTPMNEASHNDVDDDRRAVDFAVDLLAQRLSILEMLQAEPDSAFDACQTNKTLRFCWCALALNGWQPAERNLEQMAIAVTIRGQPLPRWRQRMLHSPRERSQKMGRPKEFLPRNAIIASTAIDVSRTFRFCLTRNEATHNQSACSVVKVALERRCFHLSEASISKVAMASIPFDRMFAQALDDIRRKK
jgi:hypothetical protein